MASKQNTTPTIDPVWIAPIYTNKSGEDFLGLRAVQTRITGYLLPGIITTTLRARYYSFYCWLLVEYANKHPQGWSIGKFIHRREQIFALANLAYSSMIPEMPDTGGLTGKRKLSVHWNDHQKHVRVPLDVDNYIEAALGGYNVYVGVMQSLNLSRANDDNNIEVLPRGQKLAQAFTEGIKQTKYYKERTKYDTAKTIPRAVLEEYGKNCHLSYLSTSPDRTPTLESLFAFDAKHQLPPPNSDIPTRGNMRGTLGLILDMLDQTTDDFYGFEFRRAITYGLCLDYTPYQPAQSLRPILAHWQMFQLREYYVYALYNLWCHFLNWLKYEGRQTLRTFCTHLNETVEMAGIGDHLNLNFPTNSFANWSLNDWFNTLLDQQGIPPGNFQNRCEGFARQSQAPLNEDDLFWQFDEIELNDTCRYVGTTWLLLSSLYLRLRGLQAITIDGSDAWYWARNGGTRRRSLSRFVTDMTEHIEAGDKLLETLHWLFRDYIIAQHTITSLEKWRQRNANTFHFNYEDGFLEWVEDGQSGLSASRFEQAYRMLFDLGLFETDKNRIPHLTTLGQQTLHRVVTYG
ncbi:MAG: hypothetical protein FOGNACKC_01412 [Anaerolineae bacterium]|nr:hypothetical protein [Anaerolineae bacterium]